MHRNFSCDHDFSWGKTSMEMANIFVELDTGLSILYLVTYLIFKFS